MAYFMGIDVSTTGVKAILIDQQGIVIGTANTEQPLFTPYPLWSEQNPEDWWNGAIKSIRQVLSQTGVGGQDVAAVGLTGQMHGLTLLDEGGNVLRPAILWNDQRTASQCDEIRALLGRSRLIQITGNDALTGFTAPKILWVREHEPDVYRRVKHILLPKDYVRYHLTGSFAIDRADGSGTILFDIRTRNWSPEMLAALAIPLEWLPTTYEGSQVTGEITAHAAGLTGLKAGTPVVGGGGDQAAGAVGVGAVQPGDRFAGAGYIGRGVRHHRRTIYRTRRSAACLLPFCSRPLAFDGRYALCRWQPALVPRYIRCGCGL